jgi:hypothetical protein
MFLKKKKSGNFMARVVQGARAISHPGVRRGFAFVCEELLIED